MKFSKIERIENYFENTQNLEISLLGVLESGKLSAFQDPPSVISNEIAGIFPRGSWNGTNFPERFHVPGPPKGEFQDPLSLTPN